MRSSVFTHLFTLTVAAASLQVACAAKHRDWGDAGADEDLSTGGTSLTNTHSFGGSNAAVAGNSSTAALGGTGTIAGGTAPILTTASGGTSTTGGAVAIIGGASQTPSTVPGTGGLASSSSSATGGTSAISGTAAGGTSQALTATSGTGGLTSSGGTTATGSVLAGGTPSTGGTHASGSECASLVCNTPPAASCPDAHTARTYASTGTCNSGACNYVYSDVSCPTGAACSGGTCSCVSGSKLCGTACVNFATDQENCGACGHSCLGGECSDGRCGALQLAPATDASMIELDSEHIYWASGGSSSPNSIQRVGKNGGTPELLVSNQARIFSIAVTDTRIIWSVDGGDLREKAFAGPDYALLVSMDQATSAMKYFGGWLYYIDTNIRRVLPDGGGSVQTLATEDGGANELVVIGDCVYYHKSYSGDISYYCLGLTRPSGVFYAGSSIRDGIDSDSNALYVGDKAGLVKITVDQKETVLVPGVSVGWLSVDATDVYYVQGSLGGRECGTDWSLWKVAKSGGTPQLLLDAPINCPRHLRSDSQALYWYQESNGIMKLAK